MEEPTNASMSEVDLWRKQDHKRVLIMSRFAARLAMHILILQVCNTEAKVISC